LRRTLQETLHNRRRVLREIWAEPGTSRISIAQVLDLNKSTVSKIVGDLVSEGMVVEGESGEAGPAGGRRPVGLALSPEFGYFGGCTVRPDYYESMLLSFDGEVVWWDRTVRDLVGDNLIPGVVDALDQILEESPGRLLGIGIGLPGIVDPNAGALHSSIPLSIPSPLTILDRLGTRHDCQVHVENDANTICWGELMNRAHPDLSDFVCALGEFRLAGPKDQVSVGLGLALSGRVHYGQEFTSGEFRSPFWQPDRTGQFGLDDRIIARIHGDSDAMDALVSEMATSLAFLVNTLDLSHVFLEGFFAQDFERHAAAVESCLERFWPYPGSPNCSVEQASGGKHALSRSAAALAQHDYYGHQAFGAGGINEGAMGQGDGL
jgi:hypothetical protein